MPDSSSVKSCPELASYEFRVDVAILSDMYGCQDAVKPWFHSQLLRRPEIAVVTPYQHIASIIQASYLLGEREIFHESTKAAIQ